MFGSIKKRLISSLTVIALAVCDAVPVMPINAGYRSAFGHSAAAADAGDEAERQELSYQSIEVRPNEDDPERTVTLDGMMPEGASAEAVDLTEERGALAAYDITINGGEGEFQPEEDSPIRVEIADPFISGDADLELWHIRDDGEREQITDFTAEDGKITFMAAGFSIYEIVKAEELADVKPLEGKSALAQIAEYGSEGLDVCYYGSTAQGAYDKDKGPYYFTGKVLTNIKGREGLEKTDDPDKAIKFYFIQSDVENKFYIYAVIDGTTKYLNLYKSSGNASRGGLKLSEDEDDATLFTLDKNASADCFHISGVASGTTYYIIENDNPVAVVGYTAPDDKGTAWVSIELKGTYPDDPYKLDGKTYGLMNHTSGTAGNGLAVDQSGSSLEMLSWIVRKAEGTSTYYVTEQDDITRWTFHSGKNFEDNYYISTAVGSKDMYLHIDETGISLSDEPQKIKVTPNNNTEIMLSVDGKTLTFDTNQFVVGTVNINDQNKLLSFVKLSSMTDDEEVTYSAKKIGASEIQNGQQVIVYTRIWNDNKERYEFYAVDSDGTLYPCYERGDNIMWVGGRINSLLWNFSEHYWEGTNDPNFYYDLYNPYSKKYIYPQKNDEIPLSDTRPGINMPGRRDGEYFTDILAWDDPHYAYAGLKVDTSDPNNMKLGSTSRAKAETFYFATLVDPTASLTPVDTVDNDQYGIEMKMIDFNAKQNNKPGSNEQDTVLGDLTDWNDHKNEPKSNILSTDLKTNGYPTTSADNGSGGKKSLSELYTPDKLKDVNHLFIASTYEATGYFEFDSCQNFATLKGNDSGNFTVYKELGTNDSSSKPSLKHGQFFPYNDITPGYYANDNGQNLYDALQVALPENDPRKYEKLHKVDNTNYYFGMELSASFVQTPNGKDNWDHDIIFEFTGDDDFWLYVDGELVIDLGGIHSALGGEVNFATGKVKVNGQNTTLKALFKQNYMARGDTEAEAQAKVDALFINRKIKKADGTEEYVDVFKDYSSHTMKIFYMERGAGASNLHMRFNLSYVTPGHVTLTKQISGTNDLDFDLVEYPYQIWYKTGAAGESSEGQLLTRSDDNISVTYQNSTKKVDYQASYTPPGSTTTYQSVFFINPQRSAEIHFPSNTIEYRIIECGLNKDVYDHVYVNDDEISGAEVSGSDRKAFDSGWREVKDSTSVVFRNNVDPKGLRIIKIKKILLDEEGQKLTAEQDPTTFTYRLYLSNGVTDDLPTANMYMYYVKDPSGVLCSWDVATQKFKALASGCKDYTQMNAEEKEIATFETSMNGSISKVPAGYTIEVPVLPVGIKFKVEERDYEIPLGYDLIGYQRVEGTYETIGAENIGRIITDKTPEINVVNRRGWEIKANKVWSDKDFVESHEPIFMAVYCGDTLIDGTVRAFTKDDTYVRYYFRELPVASTKLADYSVHEVELVDPVLSVDGKQLIRYASVKKKVNDGDLTFIKSTTKGAALPDENAYKVRYETGTPSTTADGADAEGNTREDTITNERSGGVVITLYDMKKNTSGGHDPLRNGKFTLMKGGTEIGKFTSDPYGRVTIMYSFERDTDYVLTETNAPEHYIGLPNAVTFRIASDDTVTVSGNDPVWARGGKFASSEENLVAYIDVFNKQFTLRAEKIEKKKQASDDTKYVQGAHFALYRGVSGVGGIVKDYTPMEGYDDLVSDENGVIPKINNMLEAGRYYLSEKIPPSGYKALTEDIVFTVGTAGDVTLVYAGASVTKDGVTSCSNAEGVVLTKTSAADEYSCVLTIPNTPSVRDYYFDIEKIIFVDKNIHDSDTEQKFLFKVERLSESTPAADIGTAAAEETFYVSLNCDGELQYTSADNITFKTGGAAYDLGLFTTKSELGGVSSEFIASGGKVKIKKTYNTSDVYTYPAAVWRGVQTVHVKKEGIYRVSEVTKHSSTDYDLWVGSNTYKGYGTSERQGLNDGYVIFNVTTVKADKFKEETAVIDSTTVHRPTASFTNSETEYAYLSSQAYAQNTIKR
ncbi:fibro-slime domain-containing protein [Ruminococcaceae bacterium FB2012]|nr:fibro-slime domain-containing protein [Ruminococcaceae bacterium FB2012]